MERIKIVSIHPEIDGGRYPVKTEIDRNFIVTCQFLTAKPTEEVYLYIKYKNKYSDNSWKKILMKNIQENTCIAEIKFDSIGTYLYTVEAEIVCHEGGKAKKTKTAYDKFLEVIVEPVYARFSAWYEMFHRSQGKIPNKSATFKDCEERLLEIKQMGFDVLYLPPIHPIGKTNRKGPNNSLCTGPNDPGCPWSIGDETGGHKAVHSDLGTLDDFKHFIKKCNELNMEVALDIALTCSYDHPYIKEHPNWFFYNHDGTIKFAENPPKKYEDTVPLNFYPPPRESSQTEDEARQEMWNEMKSIFTFWIKQGVKIFRVDNPHTKPTEFWSWLIKELKKVHPEVVLLSEAFTYYEKLEELAKVGFSQSYTYFTWRNSKNELIEYITKLTNSYLKDFLRPNLFTNTPDICPPIIQSGNKAAFKMRIALAATLSSSYGMYNGYEILEHSAFPGTETYIDSEKYQYKVWDWARENNIKDYISKLNSIRRKNSALKYFDNLTFCNSTEDNILGYIKIDKQNKSGILRGRNAILVLVNLDQYNTRQGRITIPLELVGIGSSEEYFLHELITDKVYKTCGRENWFRIEPHIEPAYIFKIVTNDAVAEGTRGTLNAMNGIKPSTDAEAGELAKKHFEYFVQLREKVIKNNDLYARRELARFFIEEISPKTFIGPGYNESYKAELDKLSQMSQYGGYLSIENMYYSIPGH
ncbi:MAG: DUF3416 domain-containing protein [Elusimicrobiota bacterium]|nr:DUF3416 domain-containing protein [Elusimicrobiota bacterium]